MRSGILQFPIITLLVLSMISIIPAHVSSEHTTLLEFDFEENDGSLTHGGTGDLWEWGRPGMGSDEDPGPLSAGSGEFAWGCPLNGSYLAGSEAFLKLPPIDSGDITSIRLEFLLWYDLLPYEDEKNETGESFFGDVLIVQVSFDDIEWEDLAHFNGSRRSWGNERIDIEDISGTEVYLRFILLENGDGFTDNGVFLDLIKINVEEKDITDISISPRCFIPPLVAKNEMVEVFLEALNNGREVPDGSVMTLYIEKASGAPELFSSMIIGSGPITSDTFEWYPTVTGNFRGWINLSIGGVFHEGESFSSVSYDPIFYDDSSIGMDHWNVGGPPPAVEWRTIIPEQRIRSMSSSSIFWCGGSSGGSNGSSGYSGSVEKYLESDWIDLRYYNSASLHFYHRFKSDGDMGSSGGIVQGLTREGSWMTLDPKIGTYGALDNGIASSIGSSEAYMGDIKWSEEMFDLSDQLGARTRIRFVLVSSSSGSGEGWFIDDIIVSGKGYDPYDDEPPARIEGLEISVVDEGAVSLEWYPSIAQDFNIYNIFIEEFEIVDVSDLVPYEVLTSSDLSSIILTGFDPMKVYWCTVVAEDLSGNMIQEVISIQFQPTELDLNKAPIAVIIVEGGFYTRTVGEDVILDGSGSSDPDGDDLTYIWTLPDGEVRRGKRITWRSEIEGENLEFILKVLDGYGKSSESNVTLTFISDDDVQESGQSIIPFLIFITPFVLVVVLLIGVLVVLGKRGRTDLEKRLTRVGLKMDSEGNLISSGPAQNQEPEMEYKEREMQVLDMVPVKKRSPEKKSIDEQVSLPKWKPGKKGGRTSSQRDAPVKVVLECPFCGNSFKRSMDGSLIRSGSPFEIECPHCGGKGTITP